MESAPKPLNAVQQAEVDGLRQQAKGGWAGRWWAGCIWQLWVQLACPQILSHSCLGCALVWAPRPWHSAFSFGARIATEVAQLMQHCCAHTWIRAELTERSEKLAEEGDVDASMAAVAQAERLRK